MNTLAFVFFILCCIISGCYYFWITLLALFPKKLYYHDIKYSNENDLFFFLIIPCLNEGKVIRETVTNLLSLKMPNTKVIAINDGSSDNTLEILNSIKDDNLIVLNRVLPNARQGKGMALNDCYKSIKDFADEQGIEHSKVILGILDADTFIKRSLLERVAVIMKNEPKISMVQARVRIGISTRNHLLPLMQDIEFFTIINKMQNLREYTGTVAAAGNGQFNRLLAMEDLGEMPWSKCLLEDFDFSLRLLLCGWRTCLIQDENIYQQGVISYKKLIKQRARWAQGCIQCFSYIGNVIRSKYLSIYGKIEIISFMLLPWLTLLSSITFLFSWLLLTYMYLGKSSILWFMLSSYSLNELIELLIIILVLVFLPGAIFSTLYKFNTNESIFRIILIALLVPTYNIMQIPAVLIAFYRQTFNIYSWVKTDRA